MQGRFPQSILTLDSSQAALAHIQQLPIPDGERRLLGHLGSVALQNGGSADSFVGVRRVVLAEELSLHAATISRTASKLVSRGLARKLEVGRERAWAIDWQGVWRDDVPSLPPVTSPRTPPRTTPPSVQAVPRSAPISRATACRALVFRALWLFVAPFACVARRVVIAEDRLLAMARALTECTRADAESKRDEVTIAQPTRSARVQLALAIPEESRERTPPPTTHTSATRDISSAHGGELAEGKADKPASSSAKGFFKVRKEDMQNAATVERLFARCVQAGLASPEELDDFHCWANAMRRRSSARLAPNEKPITSLAGFSASVLLAGTWRDDIHRVDREWLRNAREEAQRASAALVGAGGGGS